MHLNAYWYICVALLIFVAYRISLSRKMTPGHSTVGKERSSRCTVHRNRHLAARLQDSLRPSAQTKACDMFIKQWGSHYCTQEPSCHYANTQLLTHEASEKRGKLFLLLPPIILPLSLAASFLCVQSVTPHPPRDCSLRRWPGAPLSICQSCSGKLFGITVKISPLRAY